MHWGSFNNIYLLIIPFLVILFYIFIKNKQKSIYEKFPYLKKMINPEKRFTKLKFVFFILALIFLVLALMKPRWGIKDKKIKEKGYDIIIALDVSKSMLAKDIKPDRLTRAKKSINRFLDSTYNNQISLIAFAGVSNIVVPLTYDYNYIKNNVSIVDTNTISVQGTNFKDLMEKTILIFSKSEKDRFLIILSDGEDHKGDLNKLITEAKNNKIHIYTVPVGSEKGARIPLYNQNNKVTGFKKDNKGNYVISKVDKKLMKRISKETGGKHFDSKSIYDSLKQTLNSIKKYKQTTSKNFSMVDYKERYHYFLFLAVIFLIGSVWIPRFNKNLLKIILILFLPIILNFDILDKGNILNNKAVKKYKQKKYTESLQKFNEAKKYSNDPKLQYNIGNNYYKLKKYKQAIKHYNKSLNKLPKKSLYNIGNSYYNMKQYDKAVDSYKKLLKKYPDYKKARENLELALNKLNQQKKKDKNKNKNQKKKNNKNKNESNKNNKKQKNKNNSQKNKKKSKQNKKGNRNKQDKKKNKNKNKNKNNQKQNLKKKVYNSLLKNLRKKEKEDLKKKQKKEGRKKYGVPIPEKDW